MDNKQDICEICGKVLTPENRSKAYRHRCKECVAEQERQKRQMKKLNRDAKDLLQEADDFTHTIKIELCGGCVPQRKHVGDACYDLFVPEDTELKDGRQVINLGIKIQLPHGFCAHIRPRSGYASQGIEIKNSTKPHDADVITGIIDENYRGEIGVIVDNHKWRVMDENGKIVRPIVAKGTRIAQMEIVRVPQTEFQIVDHLDPNEYRGDNGWGSSNKDKQHEQKESA